MRTTNLSFRLQGHLRSARVLTPSKGRGPWPVILAFHGGGGNGEQFERQTGLTPKAEAAGYAVVWCEGTPAGLEARTWNDGLATDLYAHRAGIDDARYFDEVLARAPRSIDRGRVCVLGFSNGAMMGWRLLAERSERIRAAVLCAGSVPNPDAVPSRGVPVLYAHGLEDRWVPVDGGRGAHGATVHHSVDETIRWALDQIVPVRYVPFAGGHQWAGGTAISVPDTGTCPPAPDLSAEALEWFGRFVP